MLYIFAVGKMGVTFVRCGSSPAFPISICGACIRIIGINVTFFEVEDALLGGRIVFCAGVRQIRIGLKVLPFESFAVHEEVNQTNIGVNIEFASIASKIVNIGVKEVVIKMYRSLFEQLFLCFSDCVPGLDFVQAFGGNGFCGVPNEFKAYSCAVREVTAVVAFSLFHNADVHGVFFGTYALFEYANYHNEDNEGGGSTQQSHEQASFVDKFN